MTSSGAKWFQCLLILSCMIFVGIGCGRPLPDPEDVAEAPPEESSDQPKPPNIVLISLDTTRADRMSLYGYERDTTPYLKSLAASSVVFEKAYAPMGVTGPSHATMFTGLYPVGHGVVKNGLRLGADHETLAEELYEVGYQTAAVTASFVLDRKFGLNQGFGFYDDDIQPNEGFIKLQQWEGFAVEKGFDRRGEYVMQRAMRWLTQDRREADPFFLFLHLFDPHAPYLAREEIVRSLDPEIDSRKGVDQLISVYDAEILLVDTLIGQFMDQIERLGLSENTILIVTADHGEGLMDHGYLLHGLGVYEEEVHVPLLFHYPRISTADAEFRSRLN